MHVFSIDLHVMFVKYFQLALDIETETKDSNRYMDDHMVCTSYENDLISSKAFKFRLIHREYHVSVF